MRELERVPRQGSGGRRARSTRRDGIPGDGHRVALDFPRMTTRRWIALVVLVALGIGLLVVIVAVPWGDDAPTTTSTTVYHQGDDVTVDRGDEFVIALTANPTTGYEWSAAANANVTFVSSKQVTESTLPGAPGTQELTFRAE